METNQLWQNTVAELKSLLAPAVYQTFVAKTQLISLEGTKAVIACPNAYLVDMNHRRYYHLFKTALDSQTKLDTSLEFILQSVPETPSSSPKESKKTPKNNLPLFELPKSNQPPHASLKAGLHPKYTFETLVVGNSNNFAFAAAQGIVKTPGLLYNPFFIWGGVGVGKTHLMQAIGHELLKSNPDLKIRYFPAETFGNDLIYALKAKNMNQFKDKYRNLDCILVDDIQFLAGKEYIQEEFFHTFNALHMAGKQIVLTSDRKPSEIQALEDRLVSRFMGGLTVDIQLPDFEMRVAIINQKAEEKGIRITQEASQYMADNIVSNIRDIEGKLQEVSVTSMANRVGEVDLDFVKNYFSANSQESRIQNLASKLTPRHIISVCAKHFDIKTGDLCGKSRKKELVNARHITAYLLLTEINLPLEEVGRLLGGRDHTSIMHARDKIHNDFSTNPQIRTLINNIKAQF
jgi:chromosomal replication initiator protein